MRFLNVTTVDAVDDPRAQELFRQHWFTNAQQTDRMFVVLMLLQWAGSVVLSLVLTPLTADSQIHPHVWISLILGGTIAFLPIYLSWRNPGTALTRHVIAIAQVLFSSLLIHVSGGRIETHFHVFGSLAFLAFYRDWSVLVPATLLVAVDHFVRGMFWPETVFGVATASPWRWMEHAAWVIYEDVFLYMSCRNGVREMWRGVARMAELERTNSEICSAKEAAEAASRSKSAFLANMSHEIRTPLNGILGFASVLMDRNDIDAATRREHLQTIHDSGRHLLTVINDILDLSKIESGKVDVEHIRCSPHEIISEATSILRVRAKEQGLTLEYFWKSDAPETIETDPARLRQILMNLIGNAIKFTEVGSVQVAARLYRDESPKLVIDVIDTGVGISQESIERIFAPFTQADSSITRRFGGTGLGLTISRRLARLLGGDLTVNSEAGRGSIFTLVIPIGSLEGVRLIRGPLSDVIPTRPARKTDQKLPPANILLVEDGTVNRKLITLVLQRAGATVTCAENGLLGVDAAEQQSFDLILMDMQMPVMDGYTAAGELRKRGNNVPIIALTAHAMSGDMQKCLNAGCTGYLTKPIDPQRLISVVGEMLESRIAASVSPETGVAELVTVPAGSQSDVTPPTSEVLLPAATCPASEPTPEVLTSTLPMDDPDFRDIAKEFVIRLEEQLFALREACERGDQQQTAEIAHWIKGAGGTAGFSVFTQRASSLEKLAKNGGSVDAIAEIVHDLENLSGQIQIPDPQPTAY